VVDSGVVDNYPHPVVPPRIALRLKRIEDMLGMAVARADATSTLKGLGADVARPGRAGR
jgi:phenylalanyl-tRNA synthetase beta subunit